MNQLAYSVKQVVEKLGGPDVVTEYWIKKAARQLGIGTRFGRTLCFTEAQIKKLVDAHALQAQKPRQRQERTKRQQTGTPKPTPAPLPDPGGNVTPLLQSRPERARAHRRSAS